MNQMTYNSPFMNQYGPTPVILSDEEKKRKREAEIARRQAEYQNQMARSQGMLGVQNVGALGQPMVNSAVSLPPEYVEQFSSPYRAGQTTAASAGQVASILKDGAQAGLDGVVGGYKGAYNLTAPVVEGVGNFSRGLLGLEQNTEDGFRYGNQQAIPNGGALDSEMPNGGQADLSGLEKYRANGVLEDARRKMNDMGGAGVLRPEATHTMPDGTVMPGATHEEYEKSNASTTETAVEEVVKESVDPVTTIAETPTTKKAKTLQNIGDAANVDRSGTATGNKRDQTRMAIPRIGMAEKLMRIGGAITGASTQGLSAAMAAGSGAYGQLQDEERRLAQVEQQNQMSMLNKLQTMNKKTAQQEKQETEDRELFVSTKAMSTRQSFLADRLRQEGDEVTGFFDGTLKSIYDNAVGNPRSELRLALEQEVVNNTLVSIAQTKGAISNREMELFMKPIPRIGKNQEATWIAWLEMQSALNAIKAKRLDPSNLNLDGSLKSRVQADAEASAELEQLYQNLLDTGYNPFGSGQSEPNEADSVADKYL